MAIMADKETIRHVDAHWHRLLPGLGRDECKGEREMLYDVLEDGESIERLLGCSWMMTSGMKHDRAIVAATERRVILLNRGRFSKNVENVSYLSISEVQEPEPGKVRISMDEDDTEFVYDLALEVGTADLARFLRGRISSPPPPEAELSRILESGERVEGCAGCRVGLEEVSVPRPAGRADHYDCMVTRHEVAWAVATDRRLLFCDPKSYAAFVRCPHRNILAVEHRGGRGVRFVNSNRKVYSIRFNHDTDAAPFASLMRQYAGSAAQRVSAQARISAQWKLQHPLWAHRGNHGGERRKLGDVMEEDEHIEALAWGAYKTIGAGGKRRRGIIAATESRLLFVSHGWSDQHLGQLPYEGISGLESEYGKLVILPAPGYAGYDVSDIDDMNPHDSRKGGYRDTFAASLRSLVEAAHQRPIVPPSPSEPGNSSAAPSLDEAAWPASPETERLRTDQQWQERSEGLDARVPQQIVGETPRNHQGG